MNRSKTKILVLVAFVFFVATSVGAEELADKFFGDLPSLPQYQGAINERWKLENEAGRSAVSGKNLEEAERHFGAATKESEKFGRSDERAIYCRMQMAVVCADQGKYAKALYLFTECVKARSKNHAKDDPILVQLQILQRAMAQSWLDSLKPTHKVPVPRQQTNPYEGLRLD